MKCFVDKEIMRKAMEVITPPLDSDGLDTFMELEGMIRADASGKRLLIEGPSGSVEVPARVELPGVLFVPARSFIDSMLNALDETLAEYIPRIEIDATRRPFCINILSFLEQPEDMTVFPDPATAPRTWAPPPEPVEDFDEEDDPDAVAESLESDAD